MQAEWIWGFAGGLMIGGAAALYLLMNGRIIGISGIFGGLVDRSGWSNWPDHVVFVAGVVAVPAVMAWAVPGAATHITTNWPVIITGGLLVGIGSRLANGCTSGHGVCGISRLSWRSIVATLVFLLAGGITMALLRHMLGMM